jgi:hypothetical protein
VRWSSGNRASASANPGEQTQVVAVRFQRAAAGLGVVSHQGLLKGRT